MSDLTLMLIRHAEKPKENWPGPGLNSDGVEDKKSLVVRGWQRAGAWAALFGPTGACADYPQPGALYAAKPEDIGAEPSRRPYETIEPLADRLGFKPNTDFAKGEERELAARVAGLSGVVLVCWEHKAIVESLLPALAGQQRILGVPSHWDDARYDVVIRLDRNAPGAPWSLRQLFPRLLSGDSDDPL